MIPWNKWDYEGGINYGDKKKHTMFSFYTFLRTWKGVIFYSKNMYI